jgi:hypothetical protein
MITVGLNRVSKLSLLCLLVTALPLLTGCGDARYELAPVHGRVTVNGTPLEQGKVLFTPIAKGESPRAGYVAVGVIDSKGAYRLTTYDPDDGAVVGDHWAVVVNVEEDVPDGVPEFARVTFPEKLTVKPDTDNQIDLKFTREQVRKHREDDR